MGLRLWQVLGACVVALYGGVPHLWAQPTAERIGDRIVRFTDIGVRATDLEPSVALLEPRPGMGAAPADFLVEPIFFEKVSGAFNPADIGNGRSAELHNDTRHLFGIAFFEG